MSLHKHRRHEQRRRVVTAAVKLGLVVGAMGVTAFYSYRVGVELARHEVAELRAEVARLGASAETAADDAHRLRTALEESRRAVERYRGLAEQAPSGDDARELLRMVQAKLGAGLGKERLASYIAAAQAPKKCAEPITRRFVPRVKGAKGENASAKLADGMVLSAGGSAAKDATGRDEHWYDPAKPVTFTIAEAGGEYTEITGTLPLEHMLVARNSEYRFTVTPGPRGFINVAIDRCDLTRG